jgi:hypothetical protein
VVISGSQFNTEDRQILGANVQNFSPRRRFTWVLNTPLFQCIYVSLSACVFRSVWMCVQLSVCVRNKYNVCYYFFCNLNIFGIFRLLCPNESFDYSFTCLSTYSTHTFIHSVISLFSVMYSHLSAKAITFRSFCTLAHHVLQSRTLEASCRTRLRCFANNVCAQQYRGHRSKCSRVLYAGGVLWSVVVLIIKVPTTRNMAKAR